MSTLSQTEKRGTYTPTALLSQVVALFHMAFEIFAEQTRRLQLRWAQ